MKLVSISQKSLNFVGIVLLILESRWHGSKRVPKHSNEKKQQPGFHLLEF